MIPNPVEIAQRFGIHPVFAALFLAGVVTGAVHFVQFVVNWFHDWNSK